MNEPKSLDHYIAIGAVNIEGVDKNGEVIFSVSETAKEVAPELWKVHSEYVDEMLVDLFEKDLISVSYNEDLEALITVSDEGQKILKEMGLTRLDDN
jgi:hypothetical protein